MKIIKKNEKYAISEELVGDFWVSQYSRAYEEVVCENVTKEWGERIINALVDGNEWENSYRLVKDDYVVKG